MVVKLFLRHPDHDAKLQALYALVTRTHPSEKVLVFTQFADTARYLAAELRKKNNLRPHPESQ